ncbi:MAG: glycosyltransferase family 4 protein [Saccharospirillaceae bacterium]|nr:glycosyltransferase family 4 protein [Saccharospirillaceae bacterium]
MSIGSRALDGKPILMVSMPPKYSPDGGGKQAWLQAEAIASKGCHVIMLGEKSHRKTERNPIDNLEVVGLSTGLFLPRRLRKLVFMAQLILWQIINHKKYCFVHHHGITSSFYTSCILSKILRKPCFVKLSLMGVDDPSSIVASGFMGKFYIRILCMATGVFCISDALKLSCTSTDNRLKIVEITNGVDLSIFKPSEDRISLRRDFGFGDGPIVIFVGGITPRKGISTLVLGWEYIIKKVPTAKLLLIGTTKKNETYKSYHSQLVEQIELLGHSESIKFLGEKNNVPAYLQAADVFVFPTRNEGMPNALLEAMATGLPVVSSLLPGITDSVLIDGDNGYLIEDLDDHQRYSECVVDILTNRAISSKFSSRSLSYVQSNHSLDRIADKYISYYVALTC